MYALVTGASSGIGKDIARLLAKKGYGLILVARSKKALNELAMELDTKAIVIPMDLSKRKNCIRLFYMLKDKPIDVLVNNAGFGEFGEFYKSNLVKELDMINVNICALHILTKLFLRKMLKENRGHILNVASLAAFPSGPLMSSYYATKSYVYKLTAAINEEIRRSGRNVHISVFCPGPVDTDFNNKAGVSFSVKPIDSSFAAYKAVKGMFENKLIIFPRFCDRMAAFVSNAAPIQLSAAVCWHIQKKKEIRHK